PRTEEPVEHSEVWAAIDDQRRALVQLLEGLSEQEWRQPSLCEGWTVRQVAAHLALQNTTWPAMPRVVLDLIRHGGMNGAIHAMACRHAERPGEAPWAAGKGHQICGPIGALLLLLTGRRAALPQLSGPGAASLRELFTPSLAA